MNSQRTQGARALTEGALLAAITVILYIADFYTALLTYVIPVPIAILVVRNDLRTGAMAAAVSALCVGAILGPIDGLIVLVRVGLVGLVLGVGLAKKWPWVKTLIATSIASLAMMVISFFLGALVSKMSPAAIIAESQHMFIEAGNKAIEVYKKIGIPEQSLSMAKQMFDSMPKMFELFLPGIVVVGSMVIAVASWAITRWVMKRMRMEVDAVPPFESWKFGWQWSWALIGGLLLSYAGEYFKVQVLASVGRNACLVLWILYGVQGLSILWFVMDKYGVSRGAKIFIVILVFMSAPLQAILPITGLLDGWFDFRSLMS